MISVGILSTADNNWVQIKYFTDVAQLVRAGRLYRQGYGFKSLHQYGSVDSRVLLEKEVTRT